ncbi:MAG: MoaD/ThiS family protein [Acidobacteria bacterium]|nr:MoaD/ThiS family protein [Acidobacteriota bacterium]
MNKESIHITVLLFGACKEVAGVSELNCELTAPATAANAWGELKRRFAELERFERSALVAVNEEHSDRNHPLKNGDTVAIFPPVSGG